MGLPATVVDMHAMCPAVQFMLLWSTEAAPECGSVTVGFIAAYSSTRGHWVLSGWMVVFGPKLPSNIADLTITEETATL